MVLQIRFECHPGKGRRKAMKSISLTRPQVQNLKEKLKS